jgi:hypothetical protein
MVCVMTEELRKRKAEIARRNGAKSRGAKTNETRMICSRNSLKHGCYAVVHPAPDEPLDFAAGLRERWFEEKQPQTREEERLVEEMYRADLMALRFHRAMDRVLAQQQEVGLDRWEEARLGAVAKLRDAMVNGPAETIENILGALRGFGHGVRSLIADFEDLAAALRSVGFWDRERCRTAVYLLGALPGPAATAEREEVYRLVLINFQAMPERRRPPGEVERMLVPENRPLELRDVRNSDLLVPAAEARAALQEWVQESLEELRDDLERVEREVDAPMRAAILETSAILLELDDLKRFKQIGSEYRSMHHRASTGFRMLRKDGAAEKKTGKKAEKADRPKSAENEKPADRGGADAAPAATPAPAAPMATEVEIITTVGEIADDAQNAPTSETQVITQKVDAARDRAEKPDLGNEPTARAFWASRMAGMGVAPKPTGGPTTGDAASEPVSHAPRAAPESWRFAPGSFE